MTQRIKVTAPFLKSPGDAQLSEGLLMYVYVADDNRIMTGPVSALKADPKIENILAVEIFGRLVEAETRTSFFLTTISAESKLKADRFNPGGGRRPWKFVRPDGTVIEFDEIDSLELGVSSPLSWAKGKASDDPPYNFTLSDDDDRELKLDYEFAFKDAEVNNKKQANKHKCVRFRLGGSLTQVGGEGIDLNVDGGFPLSDIFGQHTLTTSHDDSEHLWAPGALRFGHFCLGEAPRGKHFWALRYAEIDGPRDPDLPNLSADFKRTVLRFDYNCVRSLDKPATRRGWGKGEETASKLWPLGVAPLGYYPTQAELPTGPNLVNRTPDISMTQRWSDPRLGGAARWELKVNWKPEAPSNGRTFTPFGAWNTLVAARHRDALRSVKGGAPASIVPQLDEPSEQAWEIVYEVADAKPHEKFLRREGGGVFKLRPEDFVFEFPTLKLLAANEEVAAAATLVNFLNVKGEPVRRRLRVSLRVRGEDAERPRAERGPRLRLECVDVTGEADAAGDDQDALVSRVGALDLLFGSKKDDDRTKEKPGFVEATFQGHPFESRFDAAAPRPAAPAWLLGIESETFFKLDGFRPGDQDLTPLEDTREEEKRPSSIIFPFGPQAENEFVNGRFLLFVEEDNDSDQTHKLLMRLESLEPAGGGAEGAEGGARTGNVDLIVIDTAPFLVARVRSNVNLSGGGEVGNWTGDDPGGASWELTDPGGSFDLILPPQGIGEEFIKTYETAPDAGRPLDYRFSPPAVFKLSRTPFKQSFSEAPWNLRRLLGFPGQRQPGMGVHSLGFELMYGLSASVAADPDDLRLTELGAVIGRMPRPLEREEVPFRLPARALPSAAQPGPQKGDFLVAAFERYAEAYAAKLVLMKTRLALLQLRRGAQKSPFLTLGEGVSFSFRCSRNVAHPFGRGESSVQDCPRPQSLAGGLKGGVDWGFTSENVYNEVIGSRVSGAGKIVNPSFTALGGSGYQEAVFANGKSTLYTDTFLGRTFFYSLERIGRIGMLWNTAKHVIIYERSVVHTDQFKDPARDEGGRPKWHGRPVMRKVREFVEILQPERSYPEFGEAPKVRGFMRASKFPQTVIYVDSAWGRDIPGGWVVPLYNPAADPDFYRRPDVRLKLSTSEKAARLPSADDAAASGGGAKPDAAEPPFTWAEVTNPENLLFYTSTDKELNRETDDWPPAAGVDFPLAEIPANPPPPSGPPGSPGPQDPQLPPPHDALNVMKGYERFTLKVDTGKVPVNLLAERIDAISDAVVENVCAVRRSLEGLRDTITNPQQQVFRTLQSVENVFDKGREYETRLREGVGRIEDALGGGKDVAAIMKAVGGLGEEAKGHIQGVVSRLEQLRADESLFGKEVVTVLENSQDKLRAAWEREFNAAAGNVKRELVEMFRRPADEVGQMKRRAEDAFAMLEVYAGNARTVLHEVEQSARRAGELLDEVTVLNTATRRANLGVLREELLALAGEARTTASAYRAAAVSAVARFEQELASIRRLLSAFGAQLSKDIDEAYKSLVDAVLPQADLTFPLTPAQKKAIEDSFKNLAAAAAAFRKKLDPSQAECLFKETIERVRSLEAAAGAQLAHVEALKQELKGIIDQAAPEQLLARVEAFVAGRLHNDLNAVRDQVKAEFFDAVKGDLTDATKKIGDEVRRAFGEVGSLQDEVKRQLERASDLPKQVLERAGQQLTEEVRRAFGDLTSAFAGPAAEALAPYERWVKEVDFQNIQNIQNLPRQFADEIKSYGANTLRLVRAHGLAPVGEAIKLSEERLAYYFNEAERVKEGAANVFRQLENAVDITPADVLVNGASGLRNKIGAAAGSLESLKSLGIALPTRRIAERFLPDLPFMNLQPPRLKDILPDFAGINLESIFSNAPFPVGKSEAIKITHGIDPATFRPWAQCDVAMELAADTEVFNIGPLTVNIVGAFFRAHTRIALDAGGGTRREVRASIRADWRLTVAGQRVLTIKNSTLHFDDSGKIKFDMGARDVELAEALRFVTDMLATTGGGDKSGLSFELVRAGALPVGARAALNLSLPALQTGAFSVSNVSLSAFFELMLAGGNFQLAVGLGLSSRERPFNLSILCLGGGGWFIVRALYRPLGGEGEKLRAMLSIGVSAGASLPFDIGVASGGVYFFVGLGVEYQTAGGQSSLTILLRVSVTGELCVLGIISVHVLLALEARYGEGALVCTGELRVKIKICWCFTLKVKASFTKRLAGGGGGGSLSDTQDPRTPEEKIEKSVKDYLKSFGD